jgi:hypothetical protein
MVLVKVDGNYFFTKPMKNKSEGSIIQTYQTFWRCITATVTVKLTTHILDNKALINFKNEIKKNCTMQVVPPDNHRQNLAEQAIQMFKNHFKAILAEVDDSFPMQL